MLKYFVKYHFYICQVSDLVTSGEIMCQQLDSSFGRALALNVMCPGSSPSLTAHFSHPVIFGAERGDHVCWLVWDALQWKFTSEIRGWISDLWGCMSWFGLGQQWGDYVSGSRIAQSVENSPCKRCVPGSSPWLHIFLTLRQQ